MVEVHARIIATVEGESDSDRLNFREDIIEALSKIQRVKSARVEVLGQLGETVGKAEFSRDPEPKRG